MIYVVAACVGVVIVILLLGIRIVSQGQVKVIERLGKYHRTLTSGLNIIIPIMDRCRPIYMSIEGKKLDEASYQYTNYIDVREKIMAFDKEPVITRDNVGMNVGLVTYFQIIDAVKALYEISNLSLAIEQLTKTNIRNIIGSLTLDETLTSRETLNNRLRIVLDEATEKWGTKVTRVELKEIEPPQEIKEAMAKQMTAERQRRAEVTHAEGQKASQILQAEGDKTARILRAEGERDAAIAQAEGQRQALHLTAQGQGAAIKTVYGAIHEGGATGDVLAIKYLETLRDIANGPANKMFIPYEASSFLASLGAIRDVLKSKQQPVQSPQLK